MYLFSIFIFTVALASEDVRNIEYCDSVQYAEYGRPATIECIFGEGFYGVFWFNSTDYINQFPLVTLKESVKGGGGYDSGEFDISTNGCLIINEVSLTHEHNYTVFKLDSLESKIEPHFIFLNVTGDIMRQPCKSPQFLELGKMGFLECFFTKPFFGIFWFDSKDHVNNAPVAMLKESGKGGIGYESGEYDLNMNGTLIINKVSLIHETTFTVYQLETVDSKVEPIFIKVVVYALPNPLYPLINDCPHQQCVVEIQREGSLRCAVKGIRPIVKLLWNLTNKEPLHSLTLYGQNYTIDSKGDVYDVMLTSRFFVNDSSVSKLNVECGIFLEERNDLFTMRSEAHLLILTDDMDNESYDEKSSTTVTWIIVAVVILIVSTIFIAGLFWKRKSHHRGKDVSDGRTMEPLLLSEEGKVEMRKEMIEALIKHYKEMYSEVQYFPLRITISKFPEHYCTKFLNFMVKGDNHDDGKARKPVPYASFFNDPYFRGKTFILEGDSGCGKSTIVQQLAYDWCTNPTVSAQQCVEILILLPFRLFGKVTSMCEAIREIYFSENSKIDEKVIEAILSESSHVLIVFDGYDENPQIISYPRKIVQTATSQKKNNFTLIITSRSRLEEETILQDIQQISLVPCTPASVRDTSLFEQDEKDDLMRRIEKVESYLETNPFLECLCSFPLFFMWADVLPFKENKYQSVAGFLQDIIVSLQKKSKDSSFENTLEDSYRRLGGDVFRKISSQDNNDTWVCHKKDIKNIIDSECFERLRKSGILVEKKVKSGDECLLHVKFCHNVFRDWFSANYIASKIKSDNTYTLNILREDLNFYQPVYFFYLFLLELSEATVVEDIIKNLSKRETLKEFLMLFKMSRDVDEVETKELIESYVSENITLSFQDSRIKQQLIICVMKIAAGLEKPISSLLLNHTFNSVDISSSKIYLKSGLLLPALSFLKELHLNVENDRRLDEGETVRVIQFAAKCEELANLRFSHCILPYKMDKDYLPAATITVIWTPESALAVYTLNFVSGQWQRENQEEPLTEDKYQRIERNFPKRM